MSSFQRTSIASTNSIQLKTKEIFRFHCGCHEDYVTITTRNLADAYCLKESPYQININSIQIKTKKL